MKTRTKKKPRSRLPIRQRKPQLNPMRYDPSRTGTMRRAFAVTIRRAFNRFKLAVREFVAKGDAFGLKEEKPQVILNSFCPTGKGGGVDPHCGKVSKLSNQQIKHQLDKLFSSGGPIEKARKELAKWTNGVDVYLHVHQLSDGKFGFFFQPQTKKISEKSLVSKHSTKDEAWQAAHEKKIAYLKPYRSKVEKLLKMQKTLMKEEDKRSGRIVSNAGQFAFATSPEKIKAFQAWIKAQIGVTIRGMTEQQQWKAYIEAGYKKGVGRAFDDATKRKVAAAGDNKDKLAFYQGTREQFLQSSFNQPQVVEKVQALAARTLEDLENVTDDMATRMTRTLVDGLIRGDGPLEVARELSDVVDIAKGRAEVIARTEIMRAHAEGQLDSFENQGVDLLGAMVEWSTAGDGRVCKLCQPLQGIVLTVDEARGMLPRHPQCRCAWVPANLGEDQTLQKRGKSKIDRAIAKSAKLGKDDFGPAEDVDRARPAGVINLATPAQLFDYSQFNGSLDRFSADIVNVFCPTERAVAKKENNK